MAFDLAQRAFEQYRSEPGITVHLMFKNCTETLTFFSIQDATKYARGLDEMFCANEWWTCKNTGVDIYVDVTNLEIVK